MSDEPGFFRLAFDGLHLSIAQLIGGMVGAGVAVPITQSVWGFFGNAQNDGVQALLLGLYALSLAVCGTWLFLGLLGRWARRSGGRGLQFVVQVGGIAVAAVLSLPGTVVVTLVAMDLTARWMKYKNREGGRHRAQKEQD